MLLIQLIGNIITEVSGNVTLIMMLTMPSYWLAILKMARLGLLRTNGEPIGEKMVTSMSLLPEVITVKLEQLFICSVSSA